MGNKGLVSWGRGLRGRMIMQKGKESLHREGIGLRGRDGMLGKCHRELMQLWDRAGRELLLPHHTVAEGWCFGGGTQRRRDCVSGRGTWDPTRQPPRHWCCSRDSNGKEPPRDGILFQPDPIPVTPWTRRQCQHSCILLHPNLDGNPAEIAQGCQGSGWAEGAGHCCSPQSRCSPGQSQQHKAMISARIYDGI